MHAVLTDINTYIIKQSCGAHDPCTFKISERDQNLAFEFGSGSEVKKFGAGFIDEFVVGIQ
jgi:hypothetical protein